MLKTMRLYVKMWKFTFLGSVFDKSIWGGREINISYLEIPKDSPTAILEGLSIYCQSFLFVSV